jgi:hypothetical protein
VYDNAPTVRQNKDLFYPGEDSPWAMMYAICAPAIWSRIDDDAICGSQAAPKT